MALSISAVWSRHMTQAPVRPRYLLTLDDGTSTWQALDGASDKITGVPESMQAVAPISAIMDVLERKPQISQVSVQLEDEFIRPILVNNRLKGQKATLELGAQGLAELIYIDRGVYIIEDIKPSDGGPATLELLDIFTYLRKKKIVGYWLNQHPIEVIKDMLDKAGVPTSLYDADTFDPGNTDYASISHFCVSRGGDRNSQRHDLAIRSPTAAFDLISELGFLLNGWLSADESGVMAFKIFDATVATSADWTDDDCRDHKQITLHDNLFNRISIAYARNEDGGYAKTYTQNDTDSQSNYKYTGEAERVVGESFDTNWLDSTAVLQTDMSDSQTSFVLLSKGGFDGWCGFRNSFPLEPATEVWQIDDPGGTPVYVDETTDFNSTTTNDVDPWPAVEAVGDQMAIGHKYQYQRVRIHMGTNGVGGTVTWKYWNGSAWAALSGVTDGTSGLTAGAPGYAFVSFTTPGDWAALSINGGASLFYIVAEVATVYSTNPKITQGWIGQLEWAECNTSRPVYILIDDEIIKCSGITFDDNYRAEYEVDDPDPTVLGRVNEGPYHARATYTVATSGRGALGTTAAAHTGSGTYREGSNAIAYDITILVEICSRLLERFGDGVSIMEVSTWFDQFGIQLGDLVSVTWDKYLGFGKDGITSSDKWEVIGKEPDLEADPPAIRWTLASASVNTPTTTHGTNSTLFDFVQNQLDNVDQTPPIGYTPVPVVVTDPGGLSATVPARRVRYGNVHSDTLNSQTVALEPSKDHYIGQNAETGATKVIGTSVGGDIPDTHPSDVAMVLVVTDATSITTIDHNPQNNEPTNAETLPKVSDNANLIPNGDFAKMW